VEGAHRFPEEGWVSGVGLVDVEVDASAGRVFERLVGCFENDGECGGATAAKGPEEVGVLLGVGCF
jgi:hypothetical protein